MTTPTHQLLRGLALCAIAGVVLLAAGSLAGCRGDRTPEPPRQFFPDLDDAPKWKAQSQSEFFADGRTMRVPPVGTVAFGRHAFVPDAVEGAAAWSLERESFLKSDTLATSGKDASGAFVLSSPFALTQADLLRGQERYNISCAACHNYNGDGKGSVGSQWSYPLPTFHDPKYRDAKVDTGKDGYLFHIARNGVWSPDGTQNKMPGYAHALSVDDTWRIVAYIRVLQSTRTGSLEDVPSEQRDAVRTMLEQAKKAAEAEAAAAGGGA